MNAQTQCGTYLNGRSYATTERRVTTFPFDKYLGHDILSDDDEDGGEGMPESSGTEDHVYRPPDGARLKLDVLSAKDRTLRRTRFLVTMDCMPGRELVFAPLGVAPGAYTNHLPLPDPDLDGALSSRRRLHQVSKTVWSFNYSLLI